MARASLQNFNGGRSLPPHQRFALTPVQTTMINIKGVKSSMLQFVRRLIVTLLFCLMVFLFGIGAFAQEFYVPSPLPSVAWSNHHIFYGEQAPESDDDSETDAVSSSTRSPEALYKSLAFKPNILRRRTTLTTIASEMELVNPGRGSEIKALLLGDGSGDIIQKMKPALAPYGLSTDNVADAYAAYWIAAWQGSRGVLDAQPDAKQIAAVKIQTGQALGNTPEFGNAINADKQAFAEVLWVQTMVIETAAQGVASNPSTMPQFKASVRAQAKSLGVDLDNFNLTPDGFELAK